jgi:hypothetical protein
MLRKAMVVISALLLLVLASYAQDLPKVSVHVKAILLDRDLNQKPVGKSKFTVISFDSQWPATTLLSTAVLLQARIEPFESFQENENSKAAHKIRSASGSRSPACQP